jgi:predicted O-methyltransferase YrrM
VSAQEQQLRGRPEEPRESPLHSARGPITLSGRLRLPAARRRARKGVVPERPWIVPAAIGWLRRRMRRDWRVLELGAGRSTPWFARRAGHLLSLEDNGYWLQQARERLEQLGLTNVELRELPVEEFADAIEGLDDASLDLVVVDFLEAPGADRVDAVRAARAKVRPGGYLLLDDSDRTPYAEAYELLEGWRERRFVGVKDGWPTVCETSIFRRPK